MIELFFYPDSSTEKYPILSVADPDGSEPFSRIWIRTFLPNPDLIKPSGSPEPIKKCHNTNNKFYKLNTSRYHVRVYIFRKFTYF